MQNSLRGNSSQNSMLIGWIPFKTTPLKKLQKLGFHEMLSIWNALCKFRTHICGAMVFRDCLSYISQLITIRVISSMQPIQTANFWKTFQIYLARSKHVYLFKGLVFLLAFYYKFHIVVSTAHDKVAHRLCLCPCSHSRILWVSSHRFSQLLSFVIPISIVSWLNVNKNYSPFDHVSPNSFMDCRYWPKSPITDESGTQSDRLNHRNK